MIDSEEINKVLMQWDSVGISNYPASTVSERIKNEDWLKDEYKGYINPIKDILINSKSKIKNIKNLIYAIELDITGVSLNENKEKSLKSKGGFLEDSIYHARIKEVKKIIDKLWNLKTLSNTI